MVCLLSCFYATRCLLGSFVQGTELKKQLALCFLNGRLCGEIDARQDFFGCLLNSNENAIIMYSTVCTPGMQFQSVYIRFSPAIMSLMMVSRTALNTTLTLSVSVAQVM